ncbi:MAG: RNA-binding domain-containing protein [Promethearchaeota archaeon]
MITLKIRTIIYPSEDLKQIKRIFEYFYPFSLSTESEEIKISEPNDIHKSIASATINGLHALDFLFTQVRKQRIVEAVRKFVLERMDLNNNICKFLLHKQTLTKGSIVLCSEPEESPLGPVEIEISAENIEYVLNYLFPETEHGKVLEVSYIPEE